MTGKNEWKPSRWTPPADLAQAYNKGKDTKQLPDDSTARLSWCPEMNNRWWSYDGVLQGSESRYGNGIILIPGPEIKLKNTGTVAGFAHQSFDLLGLISLNSSCPRIFVSSNGRLVVYESTYFGDFITEITRLDNLQLLYPRGTFSNPVFYYNKRLFKEFLPEQLFYSGKNKHKDQEDVNKLRTRPQDLKDLEDWIFSLPSWTAMIINERLANTCDRSLLTGYYIDNPILFTNRHEVNVNLTEIVDSRCYNLLVLSNEKIYNNDKSMSYEELALEYGPCWLMQSLIDLDCSSSTSDNTTSLSLVNDDNHWETMIDRDLVRSACKLAGAMNAPIELWPRFYSILENQSKSRLDETTILMKLATPVDYWNLLDKTESITEGHGEFVRNTCYLMTACFRGTNYRLEDIIQAVIANLSPARPIRGQITDLVIALDDVMTNGNFDRYIPELLSGPVMTGPINGASLVAHDLNKMNISKN